VYATQGQKMKTQPKKERDARFREHDNGNMRVIPAKAGIPDTTLHGKERNARLRRGAQVQRWKVK